MTKEPSKYQAGYYKKHFHNKEYEYKSFFPTPVNDPYQWEDKRVPVLLEDAVRLLGELNAYSILIPDVDFFIAMHVRNEALKSSRIEGTRTEMDEAILPEEEIAPEKRDDWIEVQNYIKALNMSIEKLKELPICMRLLKDAHKILFSGVRGAHKQPGEIRTSQNWIGGTNIKTASFIPPHQDDLPEILKDFEYFLHNKSLLMPHLIQIAIAHYQFETIHPFSDGNGRIGRLLITLHLVDLGILKKPTLYLSDYFEKNKGQYYDGLTFVRTQNNMDQWLIYFLSAIIETAKNSKEMFEKIIELRSRYEQKIMGFGKRAKLAHKLLLKLFADPAITASKAAKSLNISISSANLLVNEFSHVDILKEITGFSRNRIFVLSEYLELFKR
jgi:Fic family protein